MKPKLIILSDIWGKQKSNWIDAYIERLNVKFDVTYYDCCELGEIDISDYRQDVLHNQFIKSGIETASKKLVELETENVNILAFSAGGAIAWKAGLDGLKIDRFYAVSSTRLRNETKKPNGYLKVYFGSEDNFKPETKWYGDLNITYQIIQQQNHEMYKQDEIANTICKEINQLTNISVDTKR
ncbi:MAG: hypothetical protein AB8B73_06305 [Ekhidna sp.]